MEDKTRLYTPSQQALEVIKSEMLLIGKKSNNSTAVNEAVIFMAKAIITLQAGARAMQKELKKEKKEKLKSNPLIIKAK